MKTSGTRLIVFSLAAAAILLLFAATGSAQCSMCRAALAGSNNALFIKNFNIGVLVLLLPPVSIFCSIFVVLKRSQSQDEQLDGDSRNSKPETRD